MNDTTSVLELPGRADSDSGAGRGSVYFVGTATVILRYAGISILTDPNFLHQGDHVHLGYGLSSRRLTQPAIEFEALPPIDLVLLSHLHEDHFDRLVQQKLDRDVPILTTPRAAETLARQGFRATHGLPTWESKLIVKAGARVRITATPARHGPRLVSRLLPDVMGSMVDLLGPDEGVGYRIYISGDTTLHQALNDIPRRYPAIDLGLMHLGGARIMGVLLTMDAKQGVEAIRLIQPDLTIPVHYNDYTVFKSPIDDFMRELERAGLSSRVRYLKHGDTYTFEVPSLRARAVPTPMPSPHERRPAVD